MSIALLFAIITITLALIFYTIGVWSEHKSIWLVPYIIGMVMGMM